MTNSTRPRRVKRRAVRRHYRVSAARRLASASLAVALLMPASVSSQASSAGGVPPGVYGGAVVSSLNSAVSALGTFFGGLTGGGGRAATRVAAPAAPRLPPTKAEREVRVARLELNTDRELSLAPGGRMLFAAVPVDDSGATVHGLTARWATSDERVLRVDESGLAVAGQTGEVRLTARVGSRQETIKVTVAAPAPPAPDSADEPDPRARPAEPRRAGDRARGPAILRANWTPAESGPARAPRRAAPSVKAAAPAAPYFSVDGYTHPSNDVGSPPGRTEPGAATPPVAIEGTETPGSSNFTFAVPVAGLPGRGLSVSLSLIYNSRVWHEGNFNENGTPTSVHYNFDETWPAPGFNLGYGRIEGVRPPMGLDEFLITDADGTRHTTTRTTWSIPNDNNYDTTDGSYIHYQGGYFSGVATYTDGTRVEYGAAKDLTNPCCTNNPRSYLYPVKITDRNGNQKLISYVGGVGPKISSVQDTMGRYVRFHYDAAGELVTVTVPGYADGDDRQTVRLYYETISVNGNFSILAHGPAGGTARVVRYAYVPGTNAGYRYDYSAYGMISGIRELRGMSVSTLAENQAGAVTGEGQVAATTEYNYPAGPSNLSRAPGFTRRTDDWAGRTAGMPGTGEAPYHTFAVNHDTGLTTITAPDGTVTETLANTSDGLVKEVVVKSGAAVLSKTVNEWERVIHNGERWTPPRIKKVSLTNETGQTRTVLYGYQSWYNNVASVSERDFNLADGSPGPELRRVEASYESRAEYTSRFLVRLPTSVKVFPGGSNTPAGRTDINYDQTTPAPRSNIIMYSDPGPYRGNPTSITGYADAAGATGAETQTSAYDIAGNVTVQTKSCCFQKTYTYTEAYHYAYAESEARGDAGQLETSTGYDFNTGLARTSVDENGQLKTTDYYPNSLRHFKTTMPDGGFTEDEYFDGLYALPDASRLHSEVKTTTRLDANRTAVSYRYFDGRGALTRTLAATPDGFVTTDMEYDAMSRPRRTSNPYYSSGGAAAINPAGLWASTEYDALGRVKKIVPPGGNSALDQNVSRVEYAGTATTYTDPAGYQRRQIRDALGRLARVDEPNDAGDLGNAAQPAQPTFYAYDVLDNLIHIEQGAQHRYFRYDGLGRLTHKRHVEQDAPHHMPDPLTGNNHWSSRIEYDSRGLVVNSYDALNVRTHFEYDGLHRVREISYFNETTNATPTLTYTYGVAPNPANFYNVGRLTKVSTSATAAAPATAQEYDYDRMGRTVGQRQTVGADTYTLGYGYNHAGQLTSQSYPSGRTLTYSYDDAGRAAGLADATRTYLSGLSYGAHGGVESETFGSGAVRTFDFNERLQLEEMSLTKGGSVLQRYIYRRGRVNVETGVIDATKNNGQIGVVEGWIGAEKQWEQRVGYDAVGRLSLAAEHRGDNGALTYRAHYTYDRFGNRFQNGGQNSNVSYTPVTPADIDAATNRFTSAVTYDGAGQVTADGKFRGMQYRYDASGRMVWADTTAGGSETTAVYDGLGRRVQTVVGGQTRRMVYDIFGQLIAEYGAAPVGAGGLKYLAADAQGSTRVVTDGAGNVVARHDYLPFGEDVGAGAGRRTEAQKYNAPDPTRQLYTGNERDDGTGLDHTWWRKYEHRSGRWTTPDPYGGSMSAEDPQSFNRYAYVGNDPVNRVDPTGLYYDSLVYDIGFFGARVLDLPGFTSRIGNFTMAQEWRHDWIINTGKDPMFRDRESGSQRQEPIVPVLPVAKYEECAKLLGNAPAPGYNQTVAILVASKLEGTDPTLLAVTWGSEGGSDNNGFRYHPESNYRPEDGGWDVGPLQASTTYYNKSPYTDGLDNPFGNVFSESQPFNGNYFSSLRVGARALNGESQRGAGRPKNVSARADAAGLYRAGHRVNKKSGRPDGRYWDRVARFNSWSKGYDAFFNCLKK